MRDDIKQAISELAEHNRIAVVESGRDCDGVRYSGRVRVIRARLKDLLELEDGIAEWADGPFTLRLERPSIARRLEYTSRDLGLEAFENGHAHLIID